MSWVLNLLSGCSVSLSVSQVVGVKDERLGEQVCACIRLRKDQTSSAEEIRAFCKGQVSVADVINETATTYSESARLLYILCFTPLDFSLQDPTLCALCRQLPSDGLWKGTIYFCSHTNWTILMMYCWSV